MNQLTENDKEFIRNYVAEVDDEEEKKRRRRECAEEFSVSVPTIAAITAWTTIRANRTAIEKPVVTQVKPVEIDFDVTEGPHVDYDNPTKQLWRKKWQEFIGKNTLPSERANMTVLCLPGKRCLEVPLYLELGFKPENIFGVEGDEQAKYEFSQNAAKYGIVPKIGRIENIIKKEDTVYDVVSLDFTGPICRKYVDIVRNCPIKPDVNSRANTKSFFMINVMGKREQDFAQDLMEYYSFFTNTKVQETLANVNKRIKTGEDAKVVRDYIDMTSMFAKLENDILDGKQVGTDKQLIEKRSDSLAFLISSLISSRKWGNNPVYSSYLERFRKHKENGTDCSAIFSQIMDHLIRFLSGVASEKFLIMFATGVAEIVQMTTNFRPFVLDIEEYEYTSPVNNSNSPFLTEMLHLCTPLDDYGKIRHLIKFMFDVVLYVADHDTKGAYLSLRDKNGSMKRKSEPLKRYDEIVFTSEDKTHIASISIYRIIQADEVMLKNVGKDKVADFILGKNPFVRINLNP